MTGQMQEATWRILLLIQDLQVKKSYLYFGLHLLMFSISGCATLRDRMSIHAPAIEAD